jgi:hypothetical protein
MTDSIQAHRILRIHSAHRTVGVSGISSSFRPCNRPEASWAGELTAARTRVLLVSHFNDRRNGAAMAAFERMLQKATDIECERADLALIEMIGVGDADCVVVFGHGLAIVGDWSAFDVDGIEEDDSLDRDGRTMDVELATAARWHPVLEGVRPFSCHNGIPPVAQVRMNTTHLLIRRRAGRIVPIAWIRNGEERVFRTLLGNAEDFERPEFVRLLLNAIEWVSG